MRALNLLSGPAIAFTLLFWPSPHDGREESSMSSEARWTPGGHPLATRQAGCTRKARAAFPAASAHSAAAVAHGNRNLGGSCGSSFAPNSPKRSSSRPCTTPAVSNGAGTRQETPTTLKLMPRRGLNSSHSTKSSWGSPVLGTSVEPAAREGEAFHPSTSTGKRSAAVVLAGLRVFVIERFGGLRNAFKRMDFHQDGRISCLEFQEVIHGQERYCGLQEARDIFCLLARGTDGSLTWDDFRVRMGSTVWADAVDSATAQSPQVDGDPESIASWSCCSSDSSSRLASHALRALLFGKSSEGNPKKGEGDTDEVATTVHTLTSRSSQSAAALGKSSTLNVLNSLSAASSNMCRTMVGTEASHNTSTQLEEPGIEVAERTRLASIEAHLVPHCRLAYPDSEQVRQQQVAGTMSRSQSFGLMSRAPSSTPDYDAGAATALQKLDEGLSSLRAEVAALNFLRSSNCVAPHSTVVELPNPRSSIASTSGLEGPLRAGHLPLQHSLPPPGGLAWVRQLPQHVQGRLAACTLPLEALEVLDEALDGLVPAILHTDGESSEDDTVQGRQVFNDCAGVPTRTGSRHSKSANDLSLATQASSATSMAQSELIAASAELLRHAQAHAANLEAELVNRQRRHEMEIAELTRRQREESRRSLKRLLERLGPDRPGPHDSRANSKTLIGHGSEIAFVSQLQTCSDSCGSAAHQDIPRRRQVCEYPTDRPLDACSSG